MAPTVSFSESLTCLFSFGPPPFYSQTNIEKEILSRQCFVLRKKCCNHIKVPCLYVNSCCPNPVNEAKPEHEKAFHCQCDWKKKKRPGERGRKQVRGRQKACYVWLEFQQNEKKKSPLEMQISLTLLCIEVSSAVLSLIRGWAEFCQ